MHDFGNINLKGYKGVLKGQTFYKYTVVDGVVKPCPEKERMFILESGRGLEPDGGIRTISGHFEIDGFKGTINSYDLEAVISPAGKRLKQLNTGEFVPDPVVAPEPKEVAQRASKPRGRSAWKEDDADDE